MMHPNPMPRMPRRQKLGLFGGMAVVLLILGLGALSAFVAGWIIMLLVGAFWHTFGWFEPIGYWPAVLVGLALSVIGQLVGGSKS